MKELKELETTKKGLKQLEKEKINETIVNIPRQMHLTRFLKHKKNQTNKKEVSEKCVRMIEIFKNVIIKKK